MLLRSWTGLASLTTGHLLDVPIHELQAGKGWETICKAIMSFFRFDTRVDYVLSSPAFLEQWQLTSFQHIPHPASDHSFVIADFQQT